MWRHRLISRICTTLLPRAGERVADAYVNALLDYCESFAKFPERGTRHDDIQPGLRTVGYRRRATVAFRVKDDVVTIMRVFHGGRNVVLSDENDDAT